MRAVNLYGLRVFHAVYGHLSMTKAAQALNLTQSGVSQHIRAFEDEIGFELFARVRKRLYPTAKATELYNETYRLLASVESAVHRLGATEESPVGTVRIGLPIEFGNDVVIPRLAALGQKHPRVDFHIVLDFATTLSQMVLEGRLDFALIDRFRVDRRLKVEPVATETLLLCGRRDYIKRFGPAKMTATYFSQFDYVDYKEGEPIVRSWFKHHLGRSNLELRARAHIFDVQGVAKFIVSGLGLGVLPDHLANKLIQNGEPLTVFEGRKAPLTNEMAMIYLPLPHRPLAQRLAMEHVRG